MVKGHTKIAVERINEAFASGDVDYILENVTDDIEWTLIGQPPVQGKANLIDALQQMRHAGQSAITINSIITHGNEAAVEGTTTLTDESGKVTAFAFCDIYKLNRFKNGKFKTITSFMIEVDG